MNVKILVLGQERTYLIVSKFENTQYLGCWPVQLKNIFRGFLSDWYFSFDFRHFMVWNWPTKLFACKYCVCPIKYTNQWKAMFWLIPISVARDAILSDFRDANEAFRCILWEKINMESSKIAILLAHKINMESSKMAILLAHEPYSY